MRNRFVIASCIVASILITLGCNREEKNPLRPSQEEPEKLYFIDLQPKANQKLNEPLHSGIAGNDLSELAQGKQQLATITFDIKPAILQLGSSKVRDKPESVPGIAVNQKFTKIHFLHGTGASGAANRAQAVKDETPIGEYLLHYEDGTTVSLPIVYGLDLRDWWNWDNSKPVTRSRVAWKGKNRYSQRNNVEIRLYATTWENPTPDKTVTAIDFRSSGTTPCALFCVAMTAEP